MRSEIQEYNYDQLMGGTLIAAAKFPMGFEKETDLAFNYIPYFRGALKAMIDAGPTGKSFLKLLAKYYENILTARDQGKMIAGTTFCNTPAILYAMDIVPATFEILTALGCMVWKRGMFDYMDYAVESGMPETACSASGGFWAHFWPVFLKTWIFSSVTPRGVCDTNANAFAFSSAYLDKPFYQLNYPSTIGDARSQKYHVDDYREMGPVY